ncbi:MAG: hypothetical protein LBQ57_06600 [Spirochaetales bacterium]|jgi:hypothetical protein|nr:hypothetical protein [Spirochaetales bacterium]
MKHLFFCLFIPLLAGCMDRLVGEDVRVVFPEPPAAVREGFGSPAWKLSLSEADGTVKTIYAAAGETSVSVLIPPGPPAAIACSMMFGGRDDLFFPAGGLYPHDCGGGSLHLSWEKGFAAVFLIRLKERGYPVEAFNSGRFFRETVLRGAENPWALDEELILSSLAGLSFRADRIKLLPAHPVSLSLPAGSWLPRNPLASVVRTNEEGVCDFGYLAEGYHRYYRPDSGGKADIQIKADGILYTVTNENLSLNTLTRARE